MTKSVRVASAILILMATTATAYAAAGDIMMADFLWLRIRCPAAGYSVEQRADAIQGRVNDLLVQGGVDLSTMKVLQQGNDAVIYLADKVLITADPCMAKMNKTTPILLAQQWAERFKDIYPKAVPVCPPGQQCCPNGGCAPAEK